uniref:TLC domain-containing protein n=1 Tax=Aplanochytrium stocchinoi TaxID=215587 RepID=A0A7S3PKB8_9STRA|mmetsp:Transcript_24090/g.29480  ORF Transcript_24090/g.29480 Transcript_24090/m.29480 type:complete len:208 (-) Transcript_24090:287-910(-)
MAVGLRYRRIFLEASGWFFLVNRLSWLLFPKIAPNLIRKLSSEDRIRFHTYITSICHAIFVSIGGFLCAYELVGCTNHHAYFGHSMLAVNVSEVFISYLLQDLGILIYHYNILRDKESIIHHVIFLTISQYAVSKSYFVWPFTWLILGETSTPFVGIRWLLAVSGNKESKLYFYNGVLLLGTFFLFRGILYGHGLYDMFKNYSIWVC